MQKLATLCKTSNLLISENFKTIFPNMLPLKTFYSFVVTLCQLSPLLYNLVIFHFHDAFFLCFISSSCNKLHYIPALSFQVYHFYQGVSGTAELIDPLSLGHFCRQIISPLVSVHVQGNTVPPLWKIIKLVHNSSLKARSLLLLFFLLRPAS